MSATNDDLPRPLEPPTDVVFSMADNSSEQTAIENPEIDSVFEPFDSTWMADATPLPVGTMGTSYNTVHYTATAAEHTSTGTFLHSATGTLLHPGMEPTVGGFTRLPHEQTSTAAGTPTPFVSQFPESEESRLKPHARAWGLEDLSPDEKRNIQVILEKNAPLYETDIAQMIPTGYEKVDAPLSYAPKSTPSEAKSNLQYWQSLFRSKNQKTLSKDTSLVLASSVSTQEMGEIYDVTSQIGPDLPNLQESDYPIFGFLSRYKDFSDQDLCRDRNLREALVMRLLFRIKKGDPTIRRGAQSALMQRLTTVSVALVIDCFLQVLLRGVFEEMIERHYIIKALNRVIYHLGAQETPSLGQQRQKGTVELKPFVHRLLTLIYPMLIAGNALIRTEGKDLMMNLSRTLGVGIMITAMRPDLEMPASTQPTQITEDSERNDTADSSDSESICVNPNNGFTQQELNEHQRMVAEAFSILVEARGIAPIIPFLCTVCATGTSRSRTVEAVPVSEHPVFRILSGVKIIQRIAYRLRSQALLPHLGNLIQIVAPLLHTEGSRASIRLKQAAAMAVTGLAESVFPHGIEHFEDVIQPLWEIVAQGASRAKPEGTSEESSATPSLYMLSAALKALGSLVPLMAPENAEQCTQFLSSVWVQEDMNTVSSLSLYHTHEDMRLAIFYVIRQCQHNEGVTKNFVLDHWLKPFLKHFWNRKAVMSACAASAERKASLGPDAHRSPAINTASIINASPYARHLCDTTVALGIKTDPRHIITRLTSQLYDEDPQYRLLILEVFESLIQRMIENQTQNERRVAEDTILRLETSAESSLLEAVLYVFGTFGMSPWKSSEDTSRIATQDEGIVCQTILTLVYALGPRSTIHMDAIVKVVRHRMASGALVENSSTDTEEWMRPLLPEGTQQKTEHRSRAYSANLLAALAPYVLRVPRATHGYVTGPSLGTETLDMLRSLLRTEEDPGMIAALLHCIHEFLCSFLTLIPKGTPSPPPPSTPSSGILPSEPDNLLSEDTALDLIRQLKAILTNRDEEVQQTAAALLGLLASHLATPHLPDPVEPLTWVQLSFRLLDLLKAPSKAVRRAATAAFGAVAQAADPIHVLNTLLDPLPTPERTLRLSTTIALAVVAERCQPYLVLPFLMNEYRTPDPLTQHGVLKALGFLWEYLGARATGYAPALVPLLCHALGAADRTSRQLACGVVKHLALALRGGGMEGELVQLLNYVWPHFVAEAAGTATSGAMVYVGGSSTGPSAHGLNAVVEAIRALGVGLGPAVVWQYVAPGLFHPARKVRNLYWRVYNQMQILFGHALPPFYPRWGEIVRRRDTPVGLKSKNSFEIPELMVFL